MLTVRIDGQMRVFEDRWEGGTEWAVPSWMILVKRDSITKTLICAFSFGVNIEIMDIEKVMGVGPH